ncbi:hypothetical protein [Flavobacterium sp.]|uniref:hypothetical protein n=1 Tax=Flavobacterium sp. TaxID=239 RepID=UPI002FDB869C
MTQNEIKTYFDYHNSNMKYLKIGYEEIRNQIKLFYKSTDKNGNLIYDFEDIDFRKIDIRKKEQSFNRILSGIQVSWAEESLKRLLYEKDLLNDNQRNYILKKPLIEKWLETFKIVFCIAYDLMPANDEFCIQVDIRRERNNLGNELVEQYLLLRKIISENLTPNFAIRNKVQHGEWNFAFEAPISEVFSQNLTDKIKKENIVTTTSRYLIVNSIYNMIVDLGRFKSNSFALDSITTPFEYFYEKYVKKINFEIEKIKHCDLEKFIEDIVQKEIRGIEYRNRM